MSTATTQIIISGKDQLSSVVADAGRRMGTELEGMQRNVANLQNAFVALAGATALGQIRQTYGEYDAALRDMGKLTDESMGVIADKIGEIPAELGNATELIQGYYQVISAGITEPTRAMDTMTSSVKAAKAAHVQQSEVIKGITKVMAGYAGDVKTAADAADLLFAIEKQGQTSFAELIPVIGDVAAVSKEVGVAQEEMASALAAVTLTSGSTSQAATQYRMMLVNLLKPTKEMQEAFDAMGVSSGREAINMFGLAGTLARLREYADGSGKSIAKLFESSEALLAVSALSRGEFSQYNTNLQAMEQRAGSADKAFQKWKESTQAVDDLFRNTMSNTLIKIGDEIMPTVNDSVRGFAEFVAVHDDEIAGTFGRLAEYGQTIGSAVVPALRDAGATLKDTVLPPVVGILETTNALIGLVPSEYQSSVGAGIIGYALLGPKGAVVAASIAAIDASMDQLTQTVWTLMGGTGNYASVHDQLREKGREAFEQIISGQLAATGAMHTYRGAVSHAVRGAVVQREEGKKTADSVTSGIATMTTATKGLTKEQERLFEQLDKMQLAGQLKLTESQDGLLNRNAGMEAAKSRATAYLRDMSREDLQLQTEFAEKYREIVLGETAAKLASIDEQAKAYVAAGSDEIAVAQWVAQAKLEESRAWSDGAIRGLRDYADSATNAAQLAQDAITGGFQGMEDALVSFVTTGKMEFSDLANSIISDLARIAIQQSITGPLASAAGGLLSGLFGGGVSGASAMPSGGAGLYYSTGHHDGGIVGSGEHSFVRPVPASTFAGAPRFHNGLMPDEFPAILQRGEGVFTPGQMKALGGSNVVVNVIESPGNGGQRQERQEGGTTIIDIMVEQIEAKLASNTMRGQGPLYSANKQAFGLSRSPGAY